MSMLTSTSFTITHQQPIIRQRFSTLLMQCYTSFPPRDPFLSRDPPDDSCESSKLEMKSWIRLLQHKRVFTFNTTETQESAALKTSGVRHTPCIQGEITSYFTSSFLLNIQYMSKATVAHKPRHASTRTEPETACAKTQRVEWCLTRAFSFSRTVLMDTSTREHRRTG